MCNRTNIVTVCKSLIPDNRADFFFLIFNINLLVLANENPVIHIVLVILNIILFIGIKLFVHFQNTKTDNRVGNNVIMI